MAVLRLSVLCRALCAATVLSVTAGAWSAAIAQDRMTLLLRTGEKIAGELDGMVNDRVYIRVSREEQPKIEIARIALMDVGGDASNPPEAEVREAGGDAHLLVPRDGAPVKGRFERIEGSMGSATPTPPVVIFRTESNEERRIPVSQVRRLYLGRFPGAGSSTSAGTGGDAAIGGNERVLSVGGTTPWVDTGIVVRPGDRVTFNASGEVTLSADANDKARPAGSVTQRRAANAPVPDAVAGALIGRVGGRATDNARAFIIGDQTTVTMPSAGRLYLGVNDDHVGDNRGQFQVRVKAESTGKADGPRRRRP